jgi:hypothetical protein
VHFQVENFKAQLLSGFDIGFLPGDFDFKIADLFHESRLVTRLIVSDSPRESNARTRDDVELLLDATIFMNSTFTPNHETKLQAQRASLGGWPSWQSPIVCGRKARPLGPLSKG